MGPRVILGLFLCRANFLLKLLCLNLKESSKALAKVSLLKPTGFKGIEVVERQIVWPKPAPSKKFFEKLVLQHASCSPLQKSTLITQAPEKQSVDQKRALIKAASKKEDLSTYVQDVVRVTRDFLREYNRATTRGPQFVPLATGAPVRNVPLIVRAPRPSASLLPEQERALSDTSSEGPENDLFSRQDLSESESERDSSGRQSPAIGGQAEQAEDQVRMWFLYRNGEEIPWMTIMLYDSGELFVYGPANNQPLLQEATTRDAAVQAQVAMRNVAMQIVPLRGQGRHQAWCSPFKTCLFITQLIVAWNVFVLWANAHPEYFNTGPVCV